MLEKRSVLAVTGFMLNRLLFDAQTQTFLEQTKSLFINNYDGMPLNKITSTVGLNGITW